MMYDCGLDIEKLKSILLVDDALPGCSSTPSNQKPHVLVIVRISRLNHFFNCLLKVMHYLSIMGRGLDLVDSVNVVDFFSQRIVLFKIS